MNQLYHIKLYILIILLLLNGGLYAQNSLFTDDAKAHEIFYSGNLTEAIRHFNELLRVDSMHYEYNFLNGYAYLNTNIDRTKAILHFKRALQNPKADPYIYYDLAKAYMLCYQFDDAIKYFKIFINKGLKVDKADISPERYIEMCENAKVLMKLGSNVRIDPIGEAINTPYPDYNAYINANENILYFSSKQLQNTGSISNDGFKMADVYYSECVDGKWMEAKKIQGPVNTGYIEEVVGVSADGETLLIYCNNALGFDDIYMSRKDKKQFSRPAMLSTTVNSEQTEGAAMISPDGNWLFFSSMRPGGYGGFDIYYSRRLPNGEWSNAKNAGSTINTEYNDHFPYIAPDGTTFFFSSQGHNSMGGYDLFKSTWNAEKQFFTIPENLSTPINTPDDNLTISVSKSGRYAYIADFRENSVGDIDIYKVTFLDIEAPYCIYKGVIEGIDSTDILYGKTDWKVEVRSASDKKIVGTFRPNQHSGYFTIILHPGLYLIDFYKNNVFQHSQELFVNDREPGKEQPTLKFQPQ